MALAMNQLANRLENRLKMRHYALLLAVDRHRSLTRVAKQLSLTQPTVTRALADIEEIFMTPLFVRTGRGLEPTPAGEVVLAHARIAMTDAQAMRKELEGVREGLQGLLRIGLIPYASPQVLDAAWQHLFSLQPRLAVEAHEDTTGQLVAALRSRKLDCAICRFAQDSKGDDLVQELLYQQQPHLVVGRASAAALRRKKTLDIAEISAMDWIFPPTGTPIHQMIGAIFAAAGQRVPVPVMEAYAVRTISSALRHMPRGVTVLPSDVARAVAAEGGGQMLEQALPWRLPPVGIAWLRDSPKAAVVASLSGALKRTLEAA
jgi:DNA-binding transcriptional LysR family regulator